MGTNKRYADAVDRRVGERILERAAADGTSEWIELNMADRIALSQLLPEVERLRNHEMERWEWEVRTARQLITGDGAVLLWSGDQGNLTGVTFPLSPTQLLAIGPGLPGQPNLNLLVRNNSRRWLVGVRGQFARDQGPNRAARRAQVKPGR